MSEGADEVKPRLKPNPFVVARIKLKTGPEPGWEARSEGVKE
jgi:hypothetical protein